MAESIPVDPSRVILTINGERVDPDRYADARTATVDDLRGHASFQVTGADLPAWLIPLGERIDAQLFGLAALFQATAAQALAAYGDAVRAVREHAKALAGLYPRIAPRRTRSGRWRVTLMGSGGAPRVRVYRTRDLALRALVESLGRVGR